MSSTSSRMRSLLVFAFAGVALFASPGCRGRDPAVHLSITLPAKPFKPGTDQDIEFKARNLSSHALWLDVLPAFREDARRGDIILSVVNESGTTLPYSCIFHDSVHTFYGLVPPGKTMTYRNDLGCIMWMDAPDGLYEIKARFRPRNEACKPQHDAVCFRGESNTAVASVRLANGLLSGL
jgi:hypothetical protein